MKEFINELFISEDNKRKLDSLTVDTPQELLSMIKANPFAMEKFIGKKDLEQIETHLWNTIPLGMPKNNIPVFPIMSSVFLEKAPTLMPTKYDIEERNRLFDQLQELRKESSPTIEQKDKIISLEQEITQLINDE